MPKELKNFIETDAKHGGIASQATVLFNSEDQLTAVESYGRGVYLYSLFPKRGYGVFTDHAHYVNGQVRVNTFYGSCRYIR